MPGGILVIVIIGLILVIIAIGVAFIYSWEAKIKVNNNSSYDSDTNLQSAHQKFNITSWAALIVIIILIVLVIVFFFFSELLIFVMKPLLIGTFIICFIVLCIFDYLMFSGIHDMKSSPNFNTDITTNPDDPTALRDARIGAWSVFIAIALVVGFGILLIVAKVQKSKKEKEAKKKKEESEKTDENHQEEVTETTEEVPTTEE